MLGAKVDQVKNIKRVVFKVVLSPNPTTFPPDFRFTCDVIFISIKKKSKPSLNEQTTDYNLYLFNIIQVIFPQFLTID